jgi:endonuclease/exonuclease/phosphatase family metal-dependent hydrolase
MAEKLTLVSWNLEHLMSVSGFERWREFCQPHEFSDALAQSRGQQRPKGMTFCTAHMGTGWPPRATPPKPGVSACPRQTVAVQSLAVHTERQRGLRDALMAMAADVDVFLFQEVINENALSELFSPELAKQFQILNLHDVVPKAYPVAQLLSAAVRRTKFKEIRQGAFEALAQTTEDGHRVRPGQMLDLTLQDGSRLSILNVHLKAGCNQFDLQDPWVGSRSSNPDKPVQSCDPYASVSQNTQREQRIYACAALRRQLEPLEAWIDGVSTAHPLPRRAAKFIVAGDFNRRLHAELSSRAGPARLNDEPASAAFSDKSIRLVWPELNDGDPSESRLRLAVTQGSASQVTCKHRGIDHFMVSQALAGRQGEKLSALELLEVPALVLSVADVHGKTQLPLSDHCPHKVSITLP